MPNETQQSEDAPQRRESSKRLKAISKPSDVRLKSYEYANNLWKLLVRNVGEPEARNIMRRVMGEKKPGRPKTDRDVAMIVFIYGYIIRSGLSQTDGRIANDIHKSSPCYLQYESGAVAVSNSDITETYMSFTDDPIVGREPINLGLAALKKRVERVRRYAIAEDLLARSYAPRPYSRD
jgi:hypothetical protein